MKYENKTGNKKYRLLHCKEYGDVTEIQPQVFIERAEHEKNFYIIRKSDANRK